MAFYNCPAEADVKPWPEWNDIVFPDEGVTCRFFRYFAPKGCSGNVAELELYTDVPYYTTLSASGTSAELFSFNGELRHTISRWPDKSGQYAEGGLKLSGTVNGFSATPVVRLAASETNFGTNAVEWLTNSVTVDVIPDSSGNFTYDFTNLTDRAVYYYTSFASNGTETAWSGKIYMMRTGEGRPASAQLAVTFGGESNSSLAGAYSNGSVNTVDFNRGRTGTEFFCTWDFGENFKQEISKIRLWYRPTVGSRLVGSVIAFSDDGITWETNLVFTSSMLRTDQGVDNNACLTYLAPRRTSFRYVRLDGTGAVSHNYYELNEFECLTVNPGPLSTTIIVR